MFEVINDTDQKIKELTILKKYLGYVVKKLKLDHCEFNVIMIDDQKIRKLNKEYRHIDRKTDVISFALEDNMDVIYPDFRLLGDIYISFERCYDQAKEYGHSKTREMCFLATHGILHLLGYEHETKKGQKKMFSLQEELLNGYEIRR